MKGPLIYYEIKEMYGSDLSSTKLSSELRQSVLDEIDLGFNVEIDFKDVRSITMGWGRNFIGKIVKDKGPDFVKQHMLLSNMNKKADELVCDFYNSVWEYMKSEYKPKWARLYNSEEILNDMIYLTGQYYFGGNTVPFTAGQIVDLLKSKYGK